MNNFHVLEVVGRGIDRHMRRFFFQEFMLTTAGKANLLYALEGPGRGKLSRGIIKSKASNDAFWSIFWTKSGRFCCFCDPEQDPPLLLLLLFNQMFNIRNLLLDMLIEK